MIDLDDITPKFYRILKQFAPFGPGNMTPVFMTENLTDNISEIISVIINYFDFKLCGNYIFCFS